MRSSCEPGKIDPPQNVARVDIQGGRHPVKENRVHSRQRVTSEVEFALSDGVRRAGLCRNLSLGGAQIETTEPAPFGSRVTVYLQLEGIEGEATLGGTVRWSKENAMGLQFDLQGARLTHALLETLVVSAP
jgi:hypothetical protein